MELGKCFVLFQVRIQQLAETCKGTATLNKNWEGLFGTKSWTRIDKDFMAQKEGWIRIINTFRLLKSKFTWYSWPSWNAVISFELFNILKSVNLFLFKFHWKNKNHINSTLKVSRQNVSFLKHISFQTNIGKPPFCGPF